jgi:RNA polymerase sigma factor (sigma-70 family)
LPGLEDADLVRRARDGDDRAFEEIVRRYRAPLIRYSSRHVGRDYAEDVTQHAFARAAMHLRDDPRPIHLRAWLYRVAHNAAINMRARKDWGHEELSPDVDGVPQPPEIAAQRNEVREVVSNMDELPERQRAALQLSVFEGLDYEEIACQLDTSPNSVRALLSRARSQLRKAAAALAPLPLLHWLSRKAYGLAGSPGAEGSIAASGNVVQAKVMAIAATTVVAGAATVNSANSQEPPIDPRSAAAAQAPAPVDARAVPFRVDSMIAKAGAAEASAAREEPKEQKTQPAPPPAEEAPVVAQPPAEPVAPPPAVEQPPPVVEEPPAAEKPPAGKDTVDHGGGTQPPPDEYEEPDGDEYTGGGGDEYGTPQGDAYTKVTAKG